MEDGRIGNGWWYVRPSEWAPVRIHQPAAEDIMYSSPSSSNTLQRYNTLYLREIFSLLWQVGYLCFQGRRRRRRRRKGGKRFCIVVRLELGLEWQGGLELGLGLRWRVRIIVSEGSLYDYAAFDGA
jgi:hypothetical protein